MIFSRRGFLGLVAGAFAAKPQALPTSGVAIWNAAKRCDMVTLTEHHFTVDGKRWMARTIGPEVLHIQREFNRIYMSRMDIQHQVRILSW